MLSDRTRAAMGDIRNALWMVDNALDAMLIVPEPEHGSVINQHLTLVQDRLLSIVDDPAVRELHFAVEIEALQGGMRELSLHLNNLMDKQQGPAWVYPLLPHITEGLLQPNISFETAADQALGEIAEDDGRPCASVLFGEFDGVRNLWRRMLLSIRAGMIRFASLGESSIEALEHNVNTLLPLIHTRLDALQRHTGQG